jgi:hypothetical protein
LVRINKNSFLREIPRLGRRQGQLRSRDNRVYLPNRNSSRNVTLHYESSRFESRISRACFEHHGASALMLGRFRRGERGSKPAPGGPAHCRAPDSGDPTSPEWWIRLEEVRIGDDGQGVVEIVAWQPGEFRRESYEIDRKTGHSFVTESRIERSIATNDYQALVSPKSAPEAQPDGPNHNGPT